MTATEQIKCGIFNRFVVKGCTKNLTDIDP